MIEFIVNNMWRLVGLWFCFGAMSAGVTYLVMRRKYK